MEVKPDAEEAEEAEGEGVKENAEDKDMKYVEDMEQGSRPGCQRRPRART